MNARFFPSAARPRFRFWLGAVLGLAAVFFIGVRLLFIGTEVACAQVAPGRDEPGPQLRCAFQVAAPREAVWAAFTGTGEPRPYYFDAVLEAEMRPGGRWRFLTDDRERLLAGGEVLAIESPRRFEHTFLGRRISTIPRAASR